MTNFEGIQQKFSDKKSQDGVNEFLQGVEQQDFKGLVSTIPHMPQLVDLQGEKDKKVQDGQQQCLRQITKKQCEHHEYQLHQFLCQLPKGMQGKQKPQVKELCLEIVDDLQKTYPKAFGREIETVIQEIVFLMNDIKQSVKKKQKQAMESVVFSSGNKDLKDQGFVPTVVKQCESLKNVDDCVEELQGCIFVQNVEGPQLACLIPVLWRQLSSKNELTIRRQCVIVDNMCKLVDDPREGKPLTGEIKDLVVKKVEEVSDPEQREKQEQTLETILSIEKKAQQCQREEFDMNAVFMEQGCMTQSWSEETRDFINLMGNKLNQYNVVTETSTSYSQDQWTTVFGPFQSAGEIQKVQERCAKQGEVVEEEFIDEDVNQPDLYKGSFSLQYGTLTLLRDTKLHLKKFKFYGLLGPNNCGKTTLMRQISREQVEGFPKRDELVTIFVEHEVEEREIEQEDGQMGKTKQWPLGKFNIDLSGIEFVVDTCNNIYKKNPPVTQAQQEEELGLIGFKNSITGVNKNQQQNMINPITTYSGGWKVKMQLCCAKLIEQDILMLDEPTGHLDVKNIAWMKNWLNNFPGSIIQTSQNSEFLNEMCTHIIDFQDRKLIQFKQDRGECLTKFVEKYPSKSQYFELSNKKQKFVFPEPGILEGVKSKGRSILKMTKVSFKYPGHETNTVQDITLTVCMQSRVGVVGPNGQGKSTQIKLLIGELKQEVGTVWKHSGMRMAYVAQHAFHHLEKHMTKTPCQYILWRFQGNDDRESLENQTKEINEDEEALRQVKWCIDSKSGVVRKCIVGEKGDVPIYPDCILNRRKNKQKKYEYEVKMMHKPIESQVWIERDTMVQMGYEKLVCREDEKQAQAQGLMSRPLTHPNVEKQLKDFGLDQESASHNPIQSLSGGQKVKVVLQAAMWQNPHILILDEPTNYLDRDGLGQLQLGLQEYGGGVVIISHNMEFTNSICQQKWIMEKINGSGRLREEGEIVNDEKIEDDQNQADEVVDQSGNKIEVKREKQMSDKDRKKQIKDIEKRLKEHKKKNNLTDQEMWDLQDKLQELKVQMGG